MRFDVIDDANSVRRSERRAVAERLRQVGIGGAEQSRMAIAMRAPLCSSSPW